MKHAGKLTPDGLRKAEKKLKELEKRFQELLSHKSEAAKLGGNDWHDNAAFEDLVQQEMVIEGQIRELKHIIRTAEIIEQSNQGEEVGIGTVVSVTIDGDKHTYTIVDSMQADPAQKKISYESPLGKVLCGTKKGDRKTLVLGSKEKTIEVMDFS